MASAVCHRVDGLATPLAQLQSTYVAIHMSLATESDSKYPWLLLERPKKVQ